MMKLIALLDTPVDRSLEASFFKSGDPFDWNNCRNRFIRSTSGDAGVLFGFNGDQSIVVKRQSSIELSIQEYVNQRLAWQLGFRAPKISIVSDATMHATVFSSLETHALKIDRELRQKKIDLLIEICKANQSDYLIPFLKKNSDAILASFQHHKSIIFNNEWDLLETPLLHFTNISPFEALVFLIFKAIIDQSDKWDPECFAKELFLDQKGILTLQENILGLSQIRYYSLNQLVSHFTSPTFLNQLGRLMAFDLFIGNEDRFLYPSDFPRFSRCKRSVFSNLGNLCIERQFSVIHHTVNYELVALDCSTQNTHPGDSALVASIFKDEHIDEFIRVNRFILETKDTNFCLKPESLAYVRNGFDHILHQLAHLKPDWAKRFPDEPKILEYAELLDARRLLIKDHVFNYATHHDSPSLLDYSLNDVEPEAPFNLEDYFQYFPSVDMDAKPQLISIIQSSIGHSLPKPLHTIIDLCFNTLHSDPELDHSRQLSHAIHSLPSDLILNHECVHILIERAKTLMVKKASSDHC